MSAGNNPLDSILSRFGKKKQETPSAEELRLQQLAEIAYGDDSKPQTVIQADILANDAEVGQLLDKIDKLSQANPENSNESNQANVSEAIILDAALPLDHVPLEDTTHGNATPDGDSERLKSEPVEALVMTPQQAYPVEMPSRKPATTDAPLSQADIDCFIPVEPKSFREARLTESEVEALILKYLFLIGNASGREISNQIKLPFLLVDELLREMKLEQMVVHKRAAEMNDYQYMLSDVGRERARRYHMECSHAGAAPVSLDDYIKGITAQSLAHQRPTSRDLNRAFDGLVLNRKILDRLGPAINSGRGMFLFGFPGNGKTSIAERVTAAFGETIWIPRSLGILGEIIHLFDPINHVEVPAIDHDGLLDDRKIDQRWVRIRRPTIIAGGELTMSQLEVNINRATGVNEAPLQLKSNCGTLVIDDFGRQKMPVDQLLNRWIVPLEKRYDFLNLPNGMKVQVPFDQLIVFSTNLEPRDLVDEAFLRRIPYKIEVVDPSEQEFRDLFRILAEKMGVGYSEPAIDYLIETHYRRANRPLRFCQPRDLLLQVKNYCAYQQIPPVMSEDFFDQACENYFAVM